MSSRSVGRSRVEAAHAEDPWIEALRRDPRGRRTRGRWPRALLGLALALASLAACAAFVLLLGLRDVGSTAGLRICAWIAGFAWVAMGSLPIARPKRPYATGLFAVGFLLAFLSWRAWAFLGAPRSGLIELGCAIAGGALGIAVSSRRDAASPRTALVAGAAVLAALVLPGADAWLAPGFGRPAFLYADVPAPARPVRIHRLPQLGPDVFAVWRTRGSLPLERLEPSESLGLEVDLGSGPRAARAVGPLDPALVPALEDGLERDLRRRLARAVETGSVPAWLGRVPLRRPDLEGRAIVLELP